MPIDFCTSTVAVSPNCQEVQANWTILSLIQDYLCCLQSSDFLKHTMNKRFQFLTFSGNPLVFAVPEEYEICLLDPDTDAALDEVQVYVNGVLQLHTSAPLDTSPASVGLINISLLSSTFTITFGGPTPDGCSVVVFVPVCLDPVDC